MEKHKLSYSLLHTKVSHGRWKGVSAIDRFWQKVDKKGEDECWEWLGSTNTKGYGVLGIKNRHFVASRVSWFIYFLHDPKNLLVCHKCDNPPCCNPTHLFLGTNSDNIKDSYDKGRSKPRNGEISGNARLTNQQAKLIRKLYIPRTNKRRFELADIFGVSEQTIQGVVYNRRYVDA